jgi:large subunit ribosomal protein L4
MKAAALRGALSDRARDGRVHVVTTFAAGDVPSTKAAAAALNAIGLEGDFLAVVTRDEESSWLSLRNLPQIMVVAPDQLNTYDVLVNDRVVFTQAAFDAFLAGPVSGRGAKAVAAESEVEA